MLIAGRWLPLLCWLLAALALAGCRHGGGNGAQVVEEYYESILLSGSKVGWSHTLRERVVEDGQRLIRTRNESHLTLTRDGEATKQSMVFTCWETPDGKLVRFESEQDGGAVTGRGKVENGTLTVTRTTLDKSETETHVWKDWGGFLAPTDSLKRDPMQPGQTRVVRSLAPLVNIAANTKLKAIGREAVELPGGKQELLKVEGTLALGKTNLEMIYWVDDVGDVQRTLVPAIDQKSLRVSKQEALKPADAKDFDLLVNSVVKLADPPDFSAVQKVVYRASLEAGQIEGVFSHGLSQRVRPINEHTAEVTVLAVRPDWPADDIAGQQDDGDYLSPTTFLQSDAPEVQSIAAAVAADEDDPWTIAVALEQHIDATIRKKNYSQAFDSAAEVARSLEGDCTEHAVLLAACLRARQVPSRVAFGLVYVPSLEGFAYHMWTEARIAGRWIPLDATQGRGGIGCDHLKLGDSVLAGGDTYTDVLKVVQVFGQLELQVVEAE